MTDPPFLSISKTESLSAGEKENTPTMKSTMSLRHGKIFAEQAENILLVPVQILEPAFRSLGIV